MRESCNDIAASVCFGVVGVALLIAGGVQHHNEVVNATATKISVMLLSGGVSSLFSSFLFCLPRCCKSRQIENDAPTTNSPSDGDKSEA